MEKSERRKTVINSITADSENVCSQITLVALTAP